MQGIGPGRLVIVAGPTATGKTQAAIALAGRLNAEIVCADSRTVYRGLDTGTAKPTLRDRATVPHHLLDVADPGEPFTLADYQRLALEAIDGIHDRGRIAILTGGTGLYIRAVVDRIAVPAAAPDWDLRERLAVEERRGGPGTLHRRLHEIDPAAAARIHPRNVRRVIRALEVYEATGRTISAFQAEVRGGRWAAGREEGEVRMVALTVDRERLYERLDRRIDAQLAAGLVEEVRTLLRAGYDRSFPALQGLGYKEIAEHLEGEASLEAAVAEFRRNSRRYAKRQWTWFRADPRYRWIDAGDEPPERVASRIVDAPHASIPSNDSAGSVL
ncbi:MAG TPA: tRNA (adenosine(37)-N6)-dimethylallyltransferase MiaA [bacterium]|nr:tRNA (adenosine(37)-N6)-dimethylallyltransferase MiaA [bacterium]